MVGFCFLIKIFRHSKKTVENLKPLSPYIELLPTSYVFIDGLCLLEFLSYVLVEVDFHFLREKVAQGRLSVQFILTQDQIDDVFTKPLAVERFLFMKSKIRVGDRP